MIYNKSLQRRFVTGRFTPVILICISLCLWLTELFFKEQLCVHVVHSGVSGWLIDIGTLLCVVVSASLLGSIAFLEHRVRWMASFFLWIASLSFYASAYSANSLALLFEVIVVAVFFHCQQCGMPERLLYTASLLASVVALFVPSFILLLPLLMAIPYICGAMGVKRTLSLLLGLATPFWFFYGIEYVCPGTLQAVGFTDGISAFFNVDFSFPPLFYLLQSFAELLILLPFAFIFISSSVPGKPLLRRRLVCILSLYIYLWFLPFVFANEGIFYLCRLPWSVVMASYIFSLKTNRVVNIYFIVVNILWLFSLPLYLWLR